MDGSKKTMAYPVTSESATLRDSRARARAGFHGFFRKAALGHSGADMSRSANARPDQGSQRLQRLFVGAKDAYRRLLGTPGGMLR